MAKPLSLTPEVEERILDALREGNYRTAACKAAGVEYGTFRHWIRLANQGQEPYSAFSARCKEAEGESEAALVSTIRRAANQHWTAAAWLLERKYAPKWGKREMSWELAKREERERRDKELDQIPLEELEKLIAAEKARRARDGVRVVEAAE